MKSRIGGCYESILESVKRMPVVDCHEHQAIPSAYVTPKEPLAFLLRGYFHLDLLSAGMSQSDLQFLQDDSIPTEKKWPVFKRYWLRTEHTAYAREVKDTMWSYVGRTVGLESLQELGQKIHALNEESYIEFLDSLNIKALLVNILGTNDELKRFIRGEIKLPDRYKLLIPLAILHLQVRSFQGIQDIASIVGRTVTSLDEFLDIVQQIMISLKERGAVGIKNASAYVRSLDFAPVARAEAEKLFNRCLANPNDSLGWPEAKPLDDFLFHEYMRFARDMELPVQIHTGYLAGMRNRVDKANAALFTKVMELHREVAFDLFHGNWPYMGDLLFLVKNYPNAYLNLCWTHIADPIYCIDMLERAVVTVPHKKVFGFGADYGGGPELIPAHLSLAQKNIAHALTNLVSENWLSEKEAISIAADWLYNNPNELFKLGLNHYTP